MRKAVLAAVLLVTFGLLSERPFAAEPGKGKVSIERSEDIEDAFEAFDFDQVRVFTWCGGILQGKINFQNGQSIEAVDLEERIATKANLLLLKGETFDPKTMRGALVLTIKKPEVEAVKSRQCRVSIVFNFDVLSRDGKVKLGTGSRLMIEGRIPEKRAETEQVRSYGKMGAKESFTPKRGKEFTLYELKLAPN